MLLITGGTEVAFDGRDRAKCFHGLDQETFFKSITHFYARPKSIDEIPDAVVGAFKALRAPRPGPAVIELPTDVAAEEGVADIPPVVEGDRLCPDGADIDRVARVLRTAKRPAILAGSAVVHANATDALCSFAEGLNIPVVYSRLGKGVMPDGHPLTVGHCSAQAGKTILGSADLLLGIGCRFTQIDTRGWSLPLPDRQVQLDPDPRELGREYPIEAGVSGDLEQSIPQLAEVAAGFMRLIGAILLIARGPRPRPIARRCLLWVLRAIRFQRTRLLWWMLRLLGIARLMSIRLLFRVRFFIPVIRLRWVLQFPLLLARSSRVQISRLSRFVAMADFR